MDAFGGFDPRRDKDAALKLLLDALAADHRLEDLADFMRPTSTLEGIEGEPGWRLERHEGGGRGSENATFRASVDPAAYALKHPVFDCAGETLARYVHSIMTIYGERHPPQE